MVHDQMVNVLMLNGFMKNSYQIPVIEVVQIESMQTLLDASSAASAPMTISGGGLIEGMNTIPADPSLGR